MANVLLRKQLGVEDYIRLRESAGWSVLSEEQVKKCLTNSIVTVSAVYNNQIVGMGRLVGDKYSICYIQDLIVLPEYQGRGIGKTIMEELIAETRGNALSNTCITVGLFASKGKEPFYEQFGFSVRPNERKGAGMEMCINTKEIKHE